VVESVVSLFINKSDFNRSGVSTRGCFESSGRRGAAA
jgi:hypothetical protein